MIELTLKRQPTVPLEAEVISPDVMECLGEAEICGLTVYHGKRQLPLGEFFEVRGERSSELKISGALEKVRWIGRAMTKGSIEVHGSVGMHLGAYMKSGLIQIYGDASDWVGAEMKNGTIRISGNAGGQIGGSYRGGMSGMRNGFISVGGSAGLEVGLRMRRGTIVIGETVRDFAGLQMKGGTIVLLKGAELRTGAWMNRGTIISLKEFEMMPTFQPAGKLDSSFVNIFARHLAEYQITIPRLNDAGFYARFTGDQAVPGKGEIWMWRPATSS